MRLIRPPHDPDNYDEVLVNYNVQAQHGLQTPD